jgi:hypothetical protein
MSWQEERAGERCWQQIMRAYTISDDKLTCDISKMEIPVSPKRWRYPYSEKKAE